MKIFAQANAFPATDYRLLMAYLPLSSPGGSIVIVFRLHVPCATVPRAEDRRLRWRALRVSLTSFHSEALGKRDCSATGATSGPQH